MLVALLPISLKWLRESFTGPKKDRPEWSQASQRDSHAQQRPLQLATCWRHDQAKKVDQTFAASTCLDRLSPNRHRLWPPLHQARRGLFASGQNAERRV